MKLSILAVLLACSLALPVQAAPGGTAKSIVLRTLGGENTSMDGMQISFLVRNQDGSLMPRDHKYPFNTGHMFKVKLVSTADGNLTVTNIDPLGKTMALLNQPLVKGTETVIPQRGDQFFEFEGPKGDERLRFELIPATYNANPADTTLNPGNTSATTGTSNAQTGGGSGATTPYSNARGKSIRLVTFSDGKSDFIVRPSGTGTLVQEITVKHQ